MNIVYLLLAWCIGPSNSSNDVEVGTAILQTSDRCIESVPKVREELLRKCKTVTIECQKKEVLK